MTYLTRVHAREEFLHRVVDAAAYKREYPEMIQRVINSCSERARPPNENVADILNSYMMYLIKFSN